MDLLQARVLVSSRAQAVDEELSAVLSAYKLNCSLDGEQFLVIQDTYGDDRNFSGFAFEEDNFVPHLCRYVRVMPQYNTTASFNPLQWELKSCIG